MMAAALQNGEEASPYRRASALAERLEGIGIDPYQSANARYLVALQDSPGEIIELGRPLRGTRFFESHAIRKNSPVVADFSAYVADAGLKDCVYWGIGLTSAKAEPSDLKTALKHFNGRINIEFSELRKRHGFELLLLVIHPRFDPCSGLFDLHAHFVARVLPEQREAVKQRLMVKFSKIDLPDGPIRKAAAVATYMLWGIFRNRIMITWPDHALKAAWELTQSRFRFVRSGGSFARWKASRPSLADKAVRAIDDARKKKNRAETADPREKAVTGDRLLSKVIVKIRGIRVAALLFEATENEGPRNDTEDPTVIGPMYSSAPITVTQEVRKIAGKHRKADRPTDIIRFRDKLETCLSRWRERVCQVFVKIGELGRSVFRRLL